ncbi:MAG: hypothetical protein RJA70_3250 [Pseudomonadota bacterium]|jgi:hypothetical protein
MGVTLMCLAGSAASLYNVFSDNSALKKQAELTACPSGCFQLLGEQRSPITQTFTYQVQAENTRSERVNCLRGFLLVGTYSCNRE